jgi:CDP-glucose 4,6-dehydratase
LSYLVAKIDPHLVFHLAAQALVLESYERPLETFEVNIQGTANLLEAVISSNSLGIVVATTDKVYKNDNSGGHFKESDELWGHDPYSLSKTGTEFAVSACRNLPRAHQCKFVTVRAGNVFGPGDRAKNRLVPDLLNGLRSKESVVIRNPMSVRPWQYVLDPILGYLTVGEWILNNKAVSDAYNFGPQESSFISVGNFLELFMEQTALEVSMEGEVNALEAQVLKLDSKRAKFELNWSASTCLEDGISYTLALDSDDIQESVVRTHLQEYLSYQ